MTRNYLASRELNNSILSKRNREVGIKDFDIRLLRNIKRAIKSDDSNTNKK